MNFKDIITIAVLVAILYVVMQLMKTNKNQNEVLLAVALKTGAIKNLEDGTIEVNTRSRGKDDDEEEEEDEKETRSGKKSGKGAGAGAPKQGPKKIHKQFLSLFKDEIPKTTGQIKAMYTKQFKELDKTKFNNTLHYMTKMKLLGKDKAEGKQNFWGPIEWFDKDGLMYEDYLEKAQKES